RRVRLVAEAVELCAQMTCPAGLERVGRLERAERLEVVVEPPGVVIEERERALLELGRRILPPEEAVARELDRDLDLLAAARFPEERGIGPLVAIDPVQSLEAAPVDPE